MLTHRITFWPFMFVHLIAIACWTLGYIGGWVPILSVVLHLALLTYGSLTPDAGFFIPHSVNLEKGTLALTYDDGPVPTHTEAILDLLKSEGVKATFFCIGDRVLKHPELAKRIVAMCSVSIHRAIRGVGVSWASAKHFRRSSDVWKAYDRSLVKHRSSFVHPSEQQVRTRRTRSTKVV